jgi:TonB family protein
MQPALPMPGNPFPYYPDRLRVTYVSGEGRLRFIVTEQGLADSRSVRVLYDTHPEFTQAVLKILPQLRFYPARIGDCPVKERVVQTFRFDLQ